MTRALPLALSLLAVLPLSAANLSVAPPQRIAQPDGAQRRVDSVTLANAVCSYTLTYDVTTVPGKPEEIGSHWWVWTTRTVTLGMPSPSMANWYFQGFFNWTFDQETLHNRPATMKVLRESGPDACVEYTWDTPKVKAVLRFAVADGCDKLLLYGTYEPKQPVQQSRFLLTCYPTGFEEPRHRAVTTTARTVAAGGNLTLDPAKERWALYEDTTPDRPGCGSAGLLVGTPEAFSQVSIPVSEYGITTTCVLKPAARSFALALYDFPSVPELEASRAYFRSGGTAEAEWLERAAASGFAQPLPNGVMPAARVALLKERAAQRFERPAERWSANPQPLSFDWAAKLPGGAVKTVLACPRWQAWETMELARRLEMSVQHVYFDGPSAPAEPDYWPYAVQTGVGSLGLGAVAGRLQELTEQPGTELILLAGVNGTAVPQPAREAIVKQVAAGKGLLLAGNAGPASGWPKELLATPDAQATAQVLADFAWESVPGYRPGERGRAGQTPPVTCYRYGQGRVVVLRMNPGTYSCLVPLNSATEGLAGATDRCLAIAARAALAAAGRPRAARSGARKVHVRVQDDLDRLLADQTVPVPYTSLPLPPVPAGRTAFADVMLLDDAGRTLDFSTQALPGAAGPAFKQVGLLPGRRVHEAAPPLVNLPEGGDLRVSAELDTMPPAGARWRLAVWDTHRRVLAQGEGPLTGRVVGAVVRMSRPVDVCAWLDLAVMKDDLEVAQVRRRFTVAQPYPYDDYTALLWTYAGGEPVLQATTRAGYELGASMQDICHMGGYDDAGAAREYSVAARSGLRLVPYVTRIAGDGDSKHERQPGLFDAQFRADTKRKLAVTSRQAAPYGPAAFTLGDENYLNNGVVEICRRADTLVAFRAWLKAKYGDIGRLNDAWGTQLTSFEQVSQTMLLDEAAQQTASFAPWLDHKRFLDSGFADQHEDFARTVREQVPGAKVGFDGLLGYHWQAGYDFGKLCAHLELNQTYTTDWLQGELVRSLKRPGALTGKWGNAVADSEGGFNAWVWDGLLHGDNSVWWWTSWGCDYIPWNPDLSLNTMGKGFFDAVNETGSGPGKLLLHAQRDDSGIAVLYSQPDLFAAALCGKLGAKGPYAGDGPFLREHVALLHGLRDAGYQYHHLTSEQLEAGDLSVERERVLYLVLATCLSDKQVSVLKRYVEQGGTLVVDGRAGLLDGNGRIRTVRPLDELLGVKSPAGREALTAAASSLEVKWTGEKPEPGQPTRYTVLEPGLRLAGAEAQGLAGQVPVFTGNKVGQGHALMMNLSWSMLEENRLKPEVAQPMVLLLATAMVGHAHCPVELETADGKRPLATEIIHYTDGNLHYLAIQPDLLLRKLPDQRLHIGGVGPLYVYDMRTHQRLGEGRLTDWDIVASRNRPQVFALLPYTVQAVTLTAPQTVVAGQAAKLALKVVPGQADAAADYHVVRLDVYAPGAKAPHRQYSQNVACPNGAGTALVPLALNDAPGNWRLVARDVATGVMVERTITVTTATVR